MANSKNNNHTNTTKKIQHTTQYNTNKRVKVDHENKNEQAKTTKQNKQPQQNQPNKKQKK